MPRGLEELDNVLEAAERKMAREEEDQAEMGEGGRSGPFSYWPRIQEGEHIPSEVNAPGV